MKAPALPALKFKAHKGGHVIITTIGVLLLTLMFGVLSIDMPTYFVAQNQLQTATNAAAIAGAYKLPVGTAQAEAAALEMAQKNPVAGQTLKASDLSFQYQTGTNMSMQVNAQTAVSTVIGKLLCGFSHNSDGYSQEGQGGNGSWEDDDGASQAQCDSMKVYASSKAVPAARDTVLVIDTSSSMNDGSKPINAVKSAANKFVDTVNNLNNLSVDRIALVDFNRFGFKDIGLTAKNDSGGTGFTNVKNKINALKTYSSSTPGYVGGWNTNYYIGLKNAVDIIEQTGRKNAKKAIIFLTDGVPNLPAPPSYYAAKGAAEYRYCEDKLYAYSGYKSLNTSTKTNGVTYKTTWYLPYEKCVKNNSTGSTTCQNNLTYSTHAVKNSHVTASGAESCGDAYVSYMNNAVQGEINRAKNLDITIHTIQISDPNDDDSITGSWGMLARLQANPDWDPELLDMMADSTEGEQYATYTTNTTGIIAIYEKIAQDVKVKLSN